jgi:hypothetical protein
MNEQGKGHYSSSAHDNQNKDIPNRNACLQVKAGVDSISKKMMVFQPHLT